MHNVNYTMPVNLLSLRARRAVARDGGGERVIAHYVKVRVPGDLPERPRAHGLLCLFEELLHRRFLVRVFTLFFFR